MVLVVMALAAGTMVEKKAGIEVASYTVYNSWWFVLLLGLVGLAVVIAIVRYKMWKTPYKLLIYSSVMAILLGGGLSTWTGSHGSMTLQKGVPCSTYTDNDGTLCKIPFALTLQQFEVETYPGSHMPMDFISHISVMDEEIVISMNNIYKRGGYRFYQEDYDEEGNSTLSVSHDPIGIAVTYFGYMLLIVGLVCMFLSSKSHFRRLLKGVPLLLLLLPATVSAAPSTLPRHTADQMGRVQVLYKGRVCPLQTFAKDFTTKLYGKATYQGLTPEQVLGGWLFYYSEWCDEPIVKIKGGELRRQLGMDGRYTTVNNLLAHQALFEGRPSYAKELSAANEKLNLVLMVANSKLLKIYPLVDSLGNVGWYSQNDPLPISVDDDDYLFVRKQLGYCQELVVRGDFATLDTVFAKTFQYQQKQAASIIPSPTRLAAERLYNTLTTGRWLALLTVALGILFFALTLCTAGGERSKQAIYQRLALVLVGLLTAFLLLIIVLRWIAGRHVPMAGGFDSINLMTVTLGIVALFAARRHPSAPSIALLAMGFCQLVAMMSGSNPPITHLMPVLNSPLLTLHVTVIMIAYALFLFVMLSSVAALILPTQCERLKRTNLLMLYPAVSLLALGIIIGAVWANVTWGNYWSWDPKEVWALITLIIYLYPFYLARKERHSLIIFHLYCVLSILSVAVTYFGVNLFLGGIHAYN